MALKDNYDLTKEERQAHQEAYGRYNDMPRNFRQIDEAEIAQSSFFFEIPVLSEYRQMYTEDRSEMIAARLYFMSNGSGYGVGNDYCGEKVLWYRFDGPCDHEFEVVKASMCYRELKCTKCDYSYAVDSSD